MVHYNGKGLSKDTAQTVDVATELGTGEPKEFTGDSAQGPEPTAAEKRDAILQLMDMTQSTAVVTEMKDALLQQMKGMFPQVPDGVWQDMAREFKVEEFQELVIPIYAHHFSLEDVKALIAFYSTPAGQRILKEVPAVARESMIIGRQWGQAKAREIIQRLRSEGYQQKL
jgi:hypothetical protein